MIGAWSLAAILIIAVLFCLYFALMRLLELDRRLADGDLSLLSSDHYKVKEVIRAPLGSRIDQTPTNLMTSGIQMVPVILPDGRVGLMPLNSVLQMKRQI